MEKLVLDEIMGYNNPLEWAYKNDVVSGGKYGVFTKTTLDRYVKEGLLERLPSDTPEMQKIVPDTFRYVLTQKGLDAYKNKMRER
jgi:hypothetical protein